MSFRSSFPLLALLLGLFSLFAATTAQAQTQTTVSLSVSPNPVPEGSELSITVTLSAAVQSGSNPFFPVNISAGSASLDDLENSSLNFSFYPGIASLTVRIRIKDDEILEGDETFTIALGTMPSGYAAGSPSSVQVTIKDNDLINVSLHSAQGQFREGSSARFWVELDRPHSSSLTIPLIATDTSTAFHHKDITAEAGDYTAPSSITIPAGVTKVWGTVTANSDADTDDDTFTLAVDTANLSSLVTAGVVDKAWFTIIDDDAVQTVTLSATPSVVDEGSSVTITATLSAALESRVTIPVRVRLGTAEFFDIGMVDNITILAGQTTGTTTVATEQDVDADDETFSVYVPQYHLDQMNRSNGVWVTAGAGSSVQITIRDDDGAGESLVQRRSVTEGTTTVTLWANRIVVEGSPMTVTLTLSRALSGPVTIPLQITNRSSEAGDHEDPSEIIIAAGQTTGTVTLQTYQDTETPEEDEFLDLALGNNLPSGLVAGSVTEARITIIDDDKTLTNAYFFPAWNPMIVEEGSNTTVTVNLSKPLAQPVTLSLTFGTGITRHPLTYNAEPDDFSAPSSITIPANQTSATFTLSALQDADNDDERFLMSFDTVPTSISPEVPQIDVIILDDDNLELTLSAEKASVTEGESVQFTMTFTDPVPLQKNQSVLIPITLTGIDTEPGDIRGPTRFGVRVDGGQTSQTFFVGTGIDEDRDNETFRVALDTDRLPSWVRAGDPDSVVITIEEYQPQTQTPLELSTPLAEGLSQANLSALAETSQSSGTFVIFSTRAVAGMEEERMIGVFVIEDDPKTVLVQAQGPELANPPTSLSNVLSDPVLTVIRQSDGKQLVVNDDWEDSQKQDVTDVWAGSPNLDGGSKSSAAILTLQPGSYSAIVSGKNGATGVALIEVYDLD